MLAAHNIAPYSSFAHSHKASSSAFVLTGSPKGSSERWAWHTSTAHYNVPNFEREVSGGQTIDYTYIESPNGLVAAIKTAGSQHNVMFLATDHLGSIIGVWDAQSTLLEEHRYSAWGLRTSSTNKPRLRRGFCGHKHLQQFGLIDMQARLYDPHLGRFLAPDPYVQAPEMSMNFNRYAYCMNNPLKYVDPTGEFCITPIIIGAAAIIGAYTGGVIANEGQYNPVKWDYSAGKTWGYMLGGAAIGAASSAAGIGIGAAGGGAWWAGAAAGAISGGGFAGLASNGDPIATLKGIGIGAVSGFLGGSVASSIGGGIGALAGGAAANATSQWMHNGFDASKINWAQVAISGVGAFAMYHASTYCAYRDADLHLNGYKLTYKQYNTMQADYQRSRFWRKEFGGIFTRDGRVIRAPRKNRHSFKVVFSNDMISSAKENGNLVGTYHTHWAKPGNTFFLNENMDIVSNGGKSFIAASGPSDGDEILAYQVGGNQYLIDRYNFYLYNAYACDPPIRNMFINYFLFLF